MVNVPSFSGPRVLLRSIFHLYTVRLGRGGALASIDPKHAPWGLRKSLVKNEYERDERELVQKIIKAGDRILEIGAGIGVVGATAAKIVGSDQILSYEANHRLLETIEKNYRLNGLSANVRMRAVSASGGPIEFYPDNNIISSSQFCLSETAAPILVESDAIGDVVREFQPNTLVLDAEGAEVEILSADCVGWFQKIIVELHPPIVGQGMIDDLVSNVRAGGFTIVASAGRNVAFARDRGERR